MAIGSVMYNFDVELSDTDRNCYEQFSVRAALHPSESNDYFMTRVIAYLLEYTDGIEFGGGVSTKEDPAVMVKDLTGALVKWIEIGAPSAERVHQGSKAAESAVVYTHRNPEKVLASWQGKTIHRANEIALISFHPDFVPALVAQLERRNTIVLSKVEDELFVTLNDHSEQSALHRHTIS